MIVLIFFNDVFVDICQMHNEYAQHILFNII